MIFVTVGSQVPFDRLVGTVDAWAEQSERTDVLAQVADTSQPPKYIRWERFLSPQEYRAKIAEASLVVAHAGMGSILTALELGKPIVVMPRHGALNETRNDHQVATAKQLEAQGLVSVAWDESELLDKLEHQLGELQAHERIERFAGASLCNTVEDFIARPRTGRVDGIICFGGVDWWYHNRGHYDIQMMREFSNRLPVIYVNSIGMRTPKLGEGAVFLKRIRNKLSSWRRGFQVVRENFGVLSPISVPRFHKNKVAKSILADQIRDAAAWMGIKRPLVWVACPPAAEVLDEIPAEALVYQRTDRFEHFPGVDEAKIRAYDSYLKAEADLTLFCSSNVFAVEKDSCRKAAFVDHGVDYEDFVAAGDHYGELPHDMQSITKPRVGFVGGIDAWTFDPKLFCDVAQSLPNLSFVLVGNCSLPSDWCTLPNVHLLGRKPYEDVASYMAACDVLIMPWNKSEWIKGCNPVKLKEYLAVGRPVVSSPFDELEKYRNVVTVANNVEEFAAGIRQAVSKSFDPDILRERVETETWTRKADDVTQELKSQGIEFTSAQRDPVKPPTPAPLKPRPLAKLMGKFHGYWSAWHGLLIAVLVAVGVYVTRDAWMDIFRLASTDEESSHIWLVLPCAAWLAHVRFSEGKLPRRSGVLLGPLLIALGWLLYYMGDVRLFQSVWHLGAIVVAAGCVVTITGSAVLQRLWPAFAVLAFLIPVPGLIRQQIGLPLQNFAANATAMILETLGTEVTVQGNLLTINEVPVGIAEACNGIRMVFALLLVCFVYAYAFKMPTRTRIAVLLMSPVVAIVANVIRLVPTVWLYGYASLELADDFHFISGWLMMPITLVGLMGLRAAARWVFGWNTPQEPSSLVPSRA